MTQPELPKEGCCPCEGEEYIAGCSLNCECHEVSCPNGDCKYPGDKNHPPPVSLGWAEEESALVSLFAIHKTDDPDEVVRESMARVLNAYTKRILRTKLAEQKTGMKEVDTLRGKLEQVLWKHYSPDKAMNVEEVLDDMMPLIEKHSN